jgi:hypothetical protein
MRALSLVPFLNLLGYVPFFNLGFNCLRNDGVGHFLDMFCLGYLILDDYIDETKQFSGNRLVVVQVNLTGMNCITLLDVLWMFVVSDPRLFGRK